ncbi:MAG: DUF1638 domain-containing protein [Kiritimatiellia bacterium]
MRLMLICCEIFFREVCRLASESPHTTDIVFMPKGLHDIGAEKMKSRLQAQLDEIPPNRYDAILLWYGLCNNGVVGLAVSAAQMVIPKAHDCIALFIGSRKRYLEYFNAHPGTYYRTTGWYERRDDAGAGEETIQQKLGLFMKYEELVTRFGEDNARYIMETMGNATVHYDRLAFIKLGLPCEEPFRIQAMQEAQDKGWTFDEIEGSLELLRKLLFGEWDDDFVIVPPGRAIRATHDEHVLGFVASKGQESGCSFCCSPGSVE